MLGSSSKEKAGFLCFTSVSLQLSDSGWNVTAVCGFHYLIFNTSVMTLNCAICQRWAVIIPSGVLLWIIEREKMCFLGCWHGLTIRVLSRVPAEFILIFLVCMKAWNWQIFFAACICCSCIFNALYKYVFLKTLLKILLKDWYFIKPKEYIC